MASTNHLKILDARAKDLRTRVQRLEDMWDDSFVQCYDSATLPIAEVQEAAGSVFLAGPTSRKGLLEHNWRSEAVYQLRKAGSFNGVIYVPEPRGSLPTGDFTEKEYIHKWESDRILSATHIVFWIPRNADELLGLNTNLELGIWLGRLSNLTMEERRKKLYIGWPQSAPRMGLPMHYARHHPITGGHYIYNDLATLCEQVTRRTHG